MSAKADMKMYEELSGLPLVIAGTGGFASEVLWLVNDINIHLTQMHKIPLSLKGFLRAETDSSITEFDGLSTFSSSDLSSLKLMGCNFVVAIGNNQIRKEVAAGLEGNGLHACPPLVHPSVQMGQGVSLGHGTIAMHGSILAPHCSLGRHVLVNTSSTVGHHSRISDFVNICPGVRLGGASVIKEGCFIGSNAVTHPKSTMDEWSSLGSCSYLLKKTGRKSSWIGVPAKRFI